MGKNTKGIAVLLLVFGFTACGEFDKEDKRPAVLQPLPVEETINPEHPGIITVRDVNGDLVDDSLFADPADVYLFGIGLADGLYYYQVTDPQCTALLAGPVPVIDVPDTSLRVITVQDGGFTAPVQLAPFAVSPDEAGRYMASIVPVDQLAAADVGCLGFPEEVLETAEFRIVP